MDLIDWYTEKIIEMAKEDVATLNKHIKTSEKNMLQRLEALKRVMSKQQWYECLQEVGITEFQYLTLKNANDRGVL